MLVTTVRVVLRIIGAFRLRSRVAIFVRGLASLGLGLAGLERSAIANNDLGVTVDDSYDTN